jgi:hypothetical protein
MSEERSNPRRATLQPPNTSHLLSLWTRTDPNQSKPATPNITQEKDPQKSPTPSSSMICWTCNQAGHRKINCPQTECFFCGRPGHLKRTCLLYRLAKMYDEEKNPYSHSLAGASDPVDQEHTAIELANLNHPSTASAEQFYDEVVEIQNSLETSETQIEKSEKKLPSNQIQEIPNPTQTIQSQTQTPIESRKDDYLSFASAEQFCNEVEIKNVLETTNTQVAKSKEQFSTNQIQEILNSAQIIQSQMQIPIESGEENGGLMMCLQCPLCNKLLVSRKLVLLHFKIFHPEEDRRQIAFLRMKPYTPTNAVDNDNATPSLVTTTYQ